MLGQLSLQPLEAISGPEADEPTPHQAELEELRRDMEAAIARIEARIAENEARMTEWLGTEDRQ